MNTNKKKRYHHSKVLSWFMVVMGVLLLVSGLTTYLWSGPEVRLDRYSQPTVFTGLSIAFIGLIILVAGFYRLVFSKKVFEQEEEVDKLNDD